MDGVEARAPGGRESPAASGDKASAPGHGGAASHGPGAGPRAAGILAARTRQLAGRGLAAPGVAPLPLLACAVGAETCGLPLAAILRVVPFGACTPTPGMPPAMLGVCRHGGQVFIVLDLGAALHGQPAAAALAPDAPAPHLLLLRHGPRRFALRVGRALGATLAVPLPAGTTALPGAITGHALATGTSRNPAMPPSLPARQDPGLIALVDIGRLLRPYLPTASTSAGA